MTQLQQLRSELEDILELYDYAVSRIQQLTMEIESHKVEGDNHDASIQA